jgi:TolA-binding protein
MNRKFLLLPILVLLLLGVDAAATSADAQNNNDRRAQRALKKKWKKTARGYVRNPLALQAREEAFQNQIQQLTQKNNELTQRYTELQAQLDNCEARLRRSSQSIDSANTELQRLQSAYEILKQQCEQQRSQQTGGGSGNEAMSDRGLVYRVQVGAYERFDMTRYNAEGGNFSAETRDNLNKYLMGRFRSYNNAVAFRDDVRRLGIRDAFVVAYNDGTRIEIRDAQRIEAGGRAGFQQPGNERSTTPAPSSGASNSGTSGSNSNTTTQPQPSGGTTGNAGGGW